MLDINPPLFYGSDQKKLGQLIDYTKDLYDALSRKFENIDLTDLNFDLRKTIEHQKQNVSSTSKSVIKNITNNSSYQWYGFTDFKTGLWDIWIQGKLLIYTTNSWMTPAGIDEEQAVDVMFPYPFVETPFVVESAAGNPSLTFSNPSVGGSVGSVSRDRITVKGGTYSLMVFGITDQIEKIVADNVIDTGME